MSNWGIKISKAGKDVKTAGLEDMSFDSGYSSLMLIDEVDITFTAPENETTPSDTEVYTHNLGFTPLTVGFVDYTVGSSTYSNGPLPYNYTIGLTATYLFSYINLTVKTNTIEIYWEVDEYEPGLSVPLSDDVDYTVKLSLYGYELGTLVS